MARPIPELDLTKLAEEIKPKQTKSIIDLTVDTIRNKSTKNLVLGTLTVRTSPPSEEPKPAVIQKPEPYRPEDPFDRPFYPSKPIPHPANISPSSIPNPNPSVTANKEGFPNYGGYLYNIPGYSAFQPVNYSNNQPPPIPMQTETPQDYKPFTITGSREFKEPEEKTLERREDNNFERREENVFERRTENAFERRTENAFERRTENVFERRTENAFERRNENPFERRNENVFERREEKEAMERKESGTPKPQDFEDNFTMKIIPSISKPDVEKSLITESKMSITSLAQGSGGSVTIPTQNKEMKKKSEKYSLKTSIPISKIDMKCVSTPVDTAFQNTLKKPVFNPVFQKDIERPKVEIQSNIVIKSATINNDTDVKDKPVISDRENLKNIKPPNPPVAQSNSISTLINAAEAINKNDGPFRVPEPKVDVPKETKDPSVAQPNTVHRTMFSPKDIPSAVTQSSKLQRPIVNPVSAEVSKPSIAQPTALTRAMYPQTSKESNKQNTSPTSAISRPIFNPVSGESKPIPTQAPEVSITKFNLVNAKSIITTTKPNFPNKPPEGGFNEQKNIMFQNQNNQNSKMLLTIQPNPQVLLQRTNFESKNLQAPSRLSSQSKKNEVLADTSSKVVALKRLHQDNCDENDFENLITENQIYGNKIVVKEKSQVTQEEWKNKVRVEKQTEPEWKNKLKLDIKVEKPPESKNVVLQPNFVYLSNVQFPGNLMMIKNTPKICQTTDSTKMIVSPNENRTTEVNLVNNNNLETNNVAINSKPQVTNKEILVLKSNNNVLQTLSNNNNKTDVVFQTNQKVIVTPQVLFQVPLAVTESENKIQSAKEPKQKKEITKQVETKPDKVIITCNVDAKVPKIVITSLRPKATTSPKLLEEISTLDVYEQRKRLRRLKYLSNSNKDSPKPEASLTAKKIMPKAKINIITPDKMNAEIYREFSQTRRKGKENEESSDSDSDSEEDEVEEFNDIIERYGANYNENAKADFLAEFSLATREVLREKQLERLERTLKFDAIASAYMAAGRLQPDQRETTPEPTAILNETSETEDKSTLQRKNQFLTNFKLMQVSKRYKADFEKAWRNILRERNRRNGVPNSPEPFDPDTQLQMLTEIKKSVNENNALIKKRLDSFSDENSDIRILAEKNFSELNRLSKMADRSVKLFSGKDTKKRDLNPGFDSENIKKFKVDLKDHPKLNIPDISKIISLKTDQEASPGASTQATSMDEPSNSASCGKVMTEEVECQVEEKIPWQNPTEIMDNFIKTYREYEIVRKKEMDDITRNNTRLRVESAHVTRSASRDSDRARALLAERKHLAGEEAGLRTSLERINRALEIIRKS